MWINQGINFLLSSITTRNPQTREAESHGKMKQSSTQSILQPGGEVLHPENVISALWNLRQPPLF